MADITPPATAAVITPPGEGGIGIVALRGPGAIRVLSSAFRGTRRQAEDIPHGVIAHGRIVRDGATVDEVIVARLEGPSGDPEFEVNCHGGVVAVQAVLDCFREAGAQVVAWQSLTAPKQGTALSPAAIRSAALSELPRAHTRLAAGMLLAQAGGALSRALERLGSPEEGLSDAATDALLATAPLGRALLEPPRVLLAGPPTAGKSTLLNALLRRERVIVHPHPGTTRDVVRETVALRGVPFELMDSAGIRHGGDELEQMAIRRATDLAAECDVLVLLYDVTQPPAPDSGWMARLQAGARTILVGNKIDLVDEDVRDPRPPPSLLQEYTDAPHLLISAREGLDIDRVEAALLAPYAPLLDACEAGGPVVFTEQIEAAIQESRQQAADSGP